MQRKSVIQFCSYSGANHCWHLPKITSALYSFTCYWPWKDFSLQFVFTVFCSSVLKVFLLKAQGMKFCGREFSVTLTPMFYCYLIHRPTNNENQSRPGVLTILFYSMHKDQILWSGGCSPYDQFQYTIDT